MPNEAITSAIKSVLGEYASPEKIAALDAVLRPIYGAEAAEGAAMWRRDDARAVAMNLFGLSEHDVAVAANTARGIEELIFDAFGVTDHDR